jgi:hypothetical protein
VVGLLVSEKYYIVGAYFFETIDKLSPEIRLSEFWWSLDSYCLVQNPNSLESIHCVDSEFLALHLNSVTCLGAELITI